MKFPRLSIAKVMIPIMIIAANCAALKQLSKSDDNKEIPAIFQVSGALLVMNVLAIGLYRVASHPWKKNLFLVGFEITGFIAMFAYFAWSWVTFTEPFLDGFWDLKFVSPIYQFCEEYVLPIAFLAVMFGLPQLLIAVIGGLLTRMIVGLRQFVPAGGSAVLSSTINTEPPAAEPRSLTCA